MSTKTSAKKASAGKAGKRKTTADGKPKRNSNAFCFFAHDKAGTMTSFSPDNMKTLHEQWKQLDAKQKEAYERAAAADANRYRREKEQWENSRVKRPCNAYIQFVQHFMAKNAVNYPNVCDAVSAGAAQWKRMTEAQKAPWKKLADDASKEYAAKKPTATSAKPGPVVRAKSAAAQPKSKAKPKPTAAGSKARKPAVKSTKNKVAGTRKPPKTIKTIKPKTK